MIKIFSCVNVLIFLVGQGFCQVQPKSFAPESNFEFKIGYGLPVFKTELVDMQSFEIDFIANRIQRVVERSRHSFGKGVYVEMGYGFKSAKGLLFGANIQYLNSAKRVVKSTVKVGQVEGLEDHLYKSFSVGLLSYLGYIWQNEIVSPYFRVGPTLSVVNVKNYVQTSFTGAPSEEYTYVFQKRNPIPGLYNAIGIRTSGGNGWHYSVELFSHFARYKPQIMTMIEYKSDDGTTLFDVENSRKYVEFVDKVDQNLVIDENGVLQDEASLTARKSKQLQRTFSFHSIGFKVGVSKTIGTKNKE